MSLLSRFEVVSEKLTLELGEMFHVAGEEV
jgi:hypothetical protein